MRRTADAVVIGGGVMGCSILYNLAARGVTDTVLLEQNELASGSTSRSQAILRMHYSNEVTAQLAWESLPIFRDFEQVTGSPSGYVQTGYFLAVDEDDRDAPALLERIEAARARGASIVGSSAGRDGDGPLDEGTGSGKRPWASSRRLPCRTTSVAIRMRSFPISSSRLLTV